METEKIEKEIRREIDAMATGEVRDNLLLGRGIPAVEQLLVPIFSTLNHEKKARVQFMGVRETELSNSCFCIHCKGINKSKWGIICSVLKEMNGQLAIESAINGNEDFISYFFEKSNLQFVSEYHEERKFRVLISILTEGNFDIRRININAWRKKIYYHLKRRNIFQNRSVARLYSKRIIIESIRRKELININALVVR